MFFAIPMLLLQGAILYFAFIGIKATVEKNQGAHGLTMIRDLMKYLALLISVVITCLGLAGLLTLLIDNQSSSYDDKLSAARWLSFVFIGIPVIAIISRWIKKDFTKDLGASQEPAWQIYLLAGSTLSLLIWFIPLSSALEWLAGGEYQPRALAQSLVAFAVWVIHLQLIKLHQSIIANIHRFIGWFVGLVGGGISLVNLIDYGLSKATDLNIGTLQFQEGIILFAISAPTAIYYWQNFNHHSTELEARIYRTFAGMAVPILFATIAATFAIHQFLAWNFDTRYQDRVSFFEEVPSQIGAVIVLIPIILFFRRLVADFERDDITRSFQYLITAGGVFGIAIGIGAVVAGLLDKTDTDAILFGIAILITTGLSWVRNWRHCQFAISIDFEGEHHSPARRIFLYAATGIPTIACIGGSVWVSYNVFRALLVGGFDRIAVATPAGILVGGGVVAIYHATVLRREREN